MIGVDARRLEWDNVRLENVVLWWVRIKSSATTISPACMHLEFDARLGEIVKIITPSGPSIGCQDYTIRLSIACQCWQLDSEHWMWSSVQ